MLTTMTWHFQPKKQKKNSTDNFEEEPEDNRPITNMRSSKLEIINGIVFDDGIVVTTGQSNQLILRELQRQLKKYIQ